jgi:hypothetical protein
MPKGLNSLWGMRFSFHIRSTRTPKQGVFHGRQRLEPQTFQIVFFNVRSDSDALGRPEYPAKDKASPPYSISAECPIRIRSKGKNYGMMLTVMMESMPSLVMLALEFNSEGSSEIYRSPGGALAGRSYSQHVFFRDCAGTGDTHSVQITAPGDQDLIGDSLISGRLSRISIGL